MTKEMVAGIALQMQENRRFLATVAVWAQFENWKKCTGIPSLCQGNWEKLFGVGRISLCI
jgi:hypothetical protein